MGYSCIIYPEHRSLIAPLHRYCLFRTSEVPGLATVMAGGENASNKLDTRDGIIEHFLNLTGRQDVEFGELKCASWWRPNIRMVDSLGEGRVFVAGGAFNIPEYTFTSF